MRPLASLPPLSRLSRMSWGATRFFPVENLQGLDSVIDDPTFLEDGCKLEAAISRAATSIVSEQNDVEFFRPSSTSQNKLAFLCFLPATLNDMRQPIHAFPVFRHVFLPTVECISCHMRYKLANKAVRALGRRCRELFLGVWAEGGFQGCNSLYTLSSGIKISTVVDSRHSQNERKGGVCKRYV